MKLNRLFLSILLFGFTTACGSDDDVANASTSGTNAPAEVSLPWTAVSYKWVSNWDQCSSNSLTVSRNKQISVDNCGQTETKTISDEDFALIEKQLEPVLQNIDAQLTCAGEAIMDYSVYTFISTAEETKRMYSFDEKEKCWRGDRVQAEQLQDTLGVLHDKYLPSDLNSRN